MKKWTYEACYEEAKKYKFQAEFKRGCASAYNAAYDNGWLKEYIWFNRPEPTNKKYTKESCYELAKQYGSSSEFKKANASAYKAARINGWLSDYVWFEKLAFKWDYISCVNEAKIYKTMALFRKNCRGAYAAIKRQGWLKEFNGFFENNIDPLTLDGYLVYAYFDYDTKTVYIGLTRDFENRKRSHKKKQHSNGKYDTVASYFIDDGKEIPEPVVLVGNLIGLQAGHYENWYRECYFNLGWNVLNIAPTGAGVSSLGGGYKKWDYDKCYELALECTMKHEMREKSTQAYMTAEKNGWLKDYTWFVKTRKDMGYWNREHCREEALKYISRKRFQEGSNAAYNVARRNGWLDDYTWFVNGRLREYRRTK